MMALFGYALGLVCGFCCGVLIILQMLRETRIKPGKFPGVEGAIRRAGWRP